MATEVPILSDSHKAAADLTGDQYKMVTLDSNDEVALVSAETDVPVGVLQNDPDVGETAQIMIQGITKVEADGALNTNDQIGPSADAQAQSVVPGTDTTIHIVGVVLGGVGAAGELATAAVNFANAARAQ